MELAHPEPEGHSAKTLFCMVWIHGLAKHLLAVDGLFLMPFRPLFQGRIRPLGQVQNPVAHGREVEPRRKGPLEAVEQRALARRVATIRR